MKKKFSHVPNFTGYMKIALTLINRTSKHQKILDIPAGNGLLAEELREHGHKVVCADINKEKENFVFANMSETLPFSDNEFDTVICLEGIEHLINPTKLIKELCRVCKKDGRIIISTPNIQNLYSRFQFMCTGTFYQFPPSLPPVKNEKFEEYNFDLGHISSLSYIQLRYLFSYNHANLTKISGDKFKRKILIPILLPFLLIGYFWIKMFRKTDLAGKKIDNSHLLNPYLLFSRSLILEFSKESST